MLSVLTLLMVLASGLTALPLLFFAVTLIRLNKSLSSVLLNVILISTLGFCAILLVLTGLMLWLI